MASTSKEEKPTAPLLPAVQPKSTRKHSTVLARREWVRIVRRWICIISIQISAPGIVYYTYFYLFCIIPYFLLWNPGADPAARGGRLAAGAPASSSPPKPGGTADPLFKKALCAVRKDHGKPHFHEVTPPWASAAARASYRRPPSSRPRARRRARSCSWRGPGRRPWCCPSPSRRPPCPCRR
jgi:hypothetical protein